MHLARRAEQQIHDDRMQVAGCTEAGRQPEQMHVLRRQLLGQVDRAGRQLQQRERREAALPGFGAAEVHQPDVRRAQQLLDGGRIRRDDEDGRLGAAAVATDGHAQAGQRTDIVGTRGAAAENTHTAS